ncbi:MAG: hypothetical protein HQL94_03205 [Magnetococcales bacterium]|nr:hypothetical protein [Magnetococcales bacterium]MBF0438004.1 hypothetical protein [Magnetococcales bacterium]
MPQHLFLCITNHHLVAYPWENNTFGEATTFEQGGNDLAGFQEYLNAVPGPFTAFILIDMTEEDLKLERFPRLNAFNRTEMLESRSNRLLRNTQFRHVTLLGRDPLDKTRDCVLFSGLTEPDETVLPWLKILHDRRISLAGIWSIPLLTPRLFRDQIDPKQTDVLLLSINSGGLRQTFLHDGQIAISRLSRQPTFEAEELVPFLHGEISRMQGYLASQRLYSWSSELHVYILCHPALFTLMQAGPKSIGTTRIHPLDVTQLTAQVKLQNPLSTGKMDRLFGQCILSWRIPNHYARPEDTLIFQTLRMGKHLQWISIGLLAISLIVCLLFFGLGRSLQDQLPDLSRQAEEIQQQMKKNPVSQNSLEGERVINTVTWAELLQDHTLDPTPAFTAIGQILNKNKTLILDKLEWTTSDNTHSPAINAPPARTRPQEMQKEKQFLQVSGQVHPFNSLKEAMQTVEQFIQELRTLPECLEVQPLQMPMNIGQNVVVEGGDTSKQQDKAIFNLKIQFATQKKHNEKKPD